MIGMLEGKQTLNPYRPSKAHEPAVETSLSSTSTLAISASEVIKVLEILSPQILHGSDSSDPILQDITHAFRNTYSRATTRFDMLRQQLQSLMEPGISAKDIHPCSESWTQFAVSPNGRVCVPDVLKSVRTLEESLHHCTLSTAQSATLRLCQDSLTVSNEQSNTLLSKWSVQTTLGELFREQEAKSRAETRTVESVYWKQAYINLVRINKLYSLQDAPTDDTHILRQPLQLLTTEKETTMSVCDKLEEQLGSYESAFQGLKRQIKIFMSGLEELRLKLWYTAEIVNSVPYQNAKNIATALSQMAIPRMRPTTQMDSHARPGTSRSSGSSIFGEPQDDTMKLLKAPTEFGGPKKLADEQIESVKTWLQEQAIDNFCTGEERLHRFCMEVHLVTKKLTGDTIVQSPELWSSDLFSAERFSYGIHSVNVSSAPASTRPASVYSESFSATFPALRPAIRSAESDSRSVISDGRSSTGRGSIYNLFQQRFVDPRLLTPSLASSIGSYGRNSSANTTTSEIFSPSQSVTTQSVYSQAPSILRGGLPDFGTRPNLSTKEKKKFREQLRKGLVCLFLSDLGSLAWSRGCETDSWIQEMQANDDVDTRCQKRLQTSARLKSTVPHQTVPVRRRSITDMQVTTETESDGVVVLDTQSDMYAAFIDTLVRLSKQVDPMLKLQACADFYALAVEHLKSSSDAQSRSHADRRRSVDDVKEQVATELLQATGRIQLKDSTELAESLIVDFMKRQLAVIKPLTIFRDLQLIASFAPNETLDKNVSGSAFMAVGMAALNYKKELCSSMVDVAHEIMVAESGTTSVARAAELWKIAAREGNAVAQRELASLYLTRPELLSIVTMPLYTTADIFKDEMMWQTRVQTNDNRQALCLALHWMQKAAANNDREAKRKLQEREGLGSSVR